MAIRSIIFLVFMSFPTAFCGENCSARNCSQSCTNKDSNCPTFNCDQADERCDQLCIGSSKQCNTLSCGQSKSCIQKCVDCPTTTKLTCSSEICEQLCEGKNCDMKCTDGVKICKQICTPSSRCKMTCQGSTKCEWSCHDAECSYPVLKPLQPQEITSQCDQRQCIKKCEENCNGVTLLCHNITKCNLSCNGDCKMICDESVEECDVSCTGSCQINCKAKSCLNNGKTAAAQIMFIPIISVLQFSTFGLYIINAL